MHLQVESPGVTLQAQTMLLPAHISSAPVLEVPPARQYDEVDFGAKALVYKPQVEPLQAVLTEFAM